MIYKSLVHQLEWVVLAMEEKGETNQDIHSTVEMILKGFIREGELTPEYLALVQQVKSFQEDMERQSAMADTRAIVNINGEPINS